jgi:hypothetical protein
MSAARPTQSRPGARSRPRKGVTLVAHPRRAADTIELDVLARDAGLHPELVRRLVALGALEPIQGTRFPREAPARLARIVRLRRDLGLNYAGALLASDLLARIAMLEARLSRYETSTFDGAR